MFGLVPFGHRNNQVAGGSEPRSIFDVFNEPFFHDDFFGSMLPQGGAMRVDVKDAGDHYELAADMPGLTRDDVKLSYQNGYLTIAAEKNESHDEQDEAGRYIRRERHAGSMSRSFYIDGIDESKIDAEFRDGVLRVTLPKSTDTPRQTTINIR